MSVKVCTFNVKGIGDKNKRQQLFHWLKSNNYSICLLQELHCEEISYDLWKREWGNDMFLSGNTSNSAGVGILINTNFNYKIQSYNNIINGRMQSLKLNINEKDIMFLNIYAPNNAVEHIKFLSKFEELFQMTVKH